MALTFQQIMKFYPVNNQSVFDEIKNTFSGLSSSLVPFIGAGLSAFCNYPNWPNALKKLSDAVFDEDKKKEIKAKITDNKLLEAAQDIKEEITLRNMLSEMQHIFDYKKFDDCKQENMKLSAVYLLPKLFKNSPVMTTNFDTVIERIYENQQASFDKVVQPSQPDDLTQVRQKNAHSLFKLHGTIGQNIISHDDLVFTKDQYDLAYKADGSLAKELTEWFKNKQLLFLGCSLSIDETIKLLQRVIDNNPAVCHYAIVSCKKEDMAKRIKEIGNMGVRAIFYPDGEYDSVRVVLERLLETLDSEAYGNLLCRITDYREERSSEDNRFLYDSEYIPFTGRVSELQQLEEFCSDSKRISWWAVTGLGGIGKSRLVYEFKKKKEKEGWRVVWLKPHEYDLLNDLNLDANRTLVVADDVQANLEKIGQWLARISNNIRSEALRVLLLERDGKDLDNASWSETLQDGVSNSIQKEMCYNDSFLVLKALSETDLKNIISDYSEKRGKVLNVEQIDRLIKALKSVDSDLSRPLYALAITDAFCNGDDSTRWDKNKLLDYVVNKEIDFYKNRLRNLWGGKRKKATESELEKLLTLSCVYRVFPVREIMDKATEAWKLLAKKAESLDLDLEDMLHQIGIVQNVVLINGVTDETVEVKAVFLDCPDLVKEYLVIRNTIDKNNLDLLFTPDWANNPLVLHFMTRILNDYPDKFSNKTKVLERFLTAKPDNGLCQDFYHHLLVEITEIKNEEIAKQAVKILKRNAEETKEEYAYMLYARAMANLPIIQSENYFLEIEQQLYDLHERFISNEYIASSYMRVLSYYPDNVEFAKARMLLERGGLVCSRFESNENIATYYAESVLSIFDVIDCTDTFEQEVEKLDKVREKFRNNKGIAIWYACFIRYWLPIRPLKSHMFLIEKIVKLKNSFDSDEYITKAYYDALIDIFLVYYTNYILSIDDGMNLLSDALKSRENVLSHMWSVFERHSTEYSKQVINDIDVSIKRYNCLEFIKKYASVLVHISLYQTKQGYENKIQNILALLIQCYSSDEDINLCYAMVCFNLTLKQTEDDLKLSIQKLRDFLLKNTSTNKRFQEELDKYLKKYPNDREKYKSLVMSV